MIHSDTHSHLLIELLRAEINSTAFPASTAIVPDEWQQIFRDSKRHGVTTLTLNSISRLPDGMLPPTQLLATWIAEAERTRRANIRVNNAIHSLQEAMRHHGLPAPTIMKGQGIAALYPDPMSRQPGDIDICLSGHRPAMLKTFIRENNLKVKGSPDRSRHFIWQGVEVEIHPRLLDIHAPASLRRLKTELSLEPRTGISIHTDPDSGAKTEIRVPTPEINLLLLSAHILKHAMARGIGLRQICDLAVASRQLSPMVDRQLMQRAIDAAGLARWTNRIYSLLHFRLGLPADALPADGITLSPRKTDSLMHTILNSGNFGRQRTKASICSSEGKLATALSFLHHSPFSLTTAPREAIWSFINLTRGQFNS